MNTEIKNAVNAAELDAQYDEKAKRLLGNKIILAHILVKTVDEFYGMKPEDVVSYIEGEPYISEVPVESGLTNAVKEKNGRHIAGYRQSGSAEGRTGSLPYPEPGSFLCEPSCFLPERAGFYKYELQRHQTGVFHMAMYEHG